MRNIDSCMLYALLVYLVSSVVACTGTETGNPDFHGRIWFGAKRLTKSTLRPYLSESLDIGEPLKLLSARAFVSGAKFVPSGACDNWDLRGQGFARGPGEVNLLENLSVAQVKAEGATACGLVLQFEKKIEGGISIEFVVAHPVLGEMSYVSDFEGAVMLRADEDFVVAPGQESFFLVMHSDAFVKAAVAPSLKVPSREGGSLSADAGVSKASEEGPTFEAPLQVHALPHDFLTLHRYVGLEPPRDAESPGEAIASVQGVRANSASRVTEVLEPCRDLDVQRNACVEGHCPELLFSGQTHMRTMAVDGNTLWWLEDPSTPIGETATGRTRELFRAEFGDAEGRRVATFEEVSPMSWPIALGATDDFVYVSYYRVPQGEDASFMNRRMRVFSVHKESGQANLVHTSDNPGASPRAFVRAPADGGRNAVFWSDLSSRGEGRVRYAFEDGDTSAVQNLHVVQPWMSAPWSEEDFQPMLHATERGLAIVSSSLWGTSIEIVDIPSRAELTFGVFEDVIPPSLTLNTNGQEMMYVYLNGRGTEDLLAHRFYDHLLLPVELDRSSTSKYPSYDSDGGGFFWFHGERNLQDGETAYSLLRRPSGEGCFHTRFERNDMEAAFVHNGFVYWRTLEGELYRQYIGAP